LPFQDGDGGVLTGCGGIKSSASDLAKYLKANMLDTTYFYLAQKPITQFDEHFSGGLGWAPYSERGKVHQGAFGATPGYTCGVIFERNMRVGVVVLSNLSSTLEGRDNSIEGLCRALYDPLPFAANKKDCVFSTKEGVSLLSVVFSHGTDRQIPCLRDRRIKLRFPDRIHSSICNFKL
jgi:CubicO group peptidase (beta-lactamase class C family)